MGLLDLFIAASMPVLKVLLITALGLVLALDRIDLLGEDARNYLNNVPNVLTDCTNYINICKFIGRSGSCVVIDYLNYHLPFLNRLPCLSETLAQMIVFFVFNPALVSSNLAKTITSESMKKLWFMPINILFTFIIGSILGWAVIQITRPPQHLRGLVVGCCAAGNLGNMLLIIIPAVCKEKGSPFGDPGVCHTYGMGYASLSMAVGAIYLWSYVYNIVRISSSTSSKEVEINDSSASRSPRESSISQLGTSAESLLPSKAFNGSESPPEQLELPSTRFDHKAQMQPGTKFKQYMEIISRKINLKRLLAPSTTGALVGFIVGLIPQIRKLMIGDVAPLHVIEDTAILLGDGAIPLLTLIMGGNLLKGLTGSGIQKSLLVGIIGVRYIALPLIGIAVVKGAIHLGLVQHDPLYQFVLLLQFALPPAMNIGTITQLFGAGESECSVIMFWAYTLASVSLTLWTTFFMWLVA